MAIVTNRDKEINDIKTKIRNLLEDKLLIKMSILAKTISPILDPTRMFAYDISMNNRVIKLDKVIDHPLMLSCGHDVRIISNKFSPDINPHIRPHGPFSADMLRFEYNQHDGISRYVKGVSDDLSRTDTDKLKRWFMHQSLIIFSANRDDNRCFVDYIEPSNYVSQELSPSLILKFLEIKYNMLLDINDHIEDIQKCILSYIFRTMNLNVIVTSENIPDQFNQLRIVSNIILLRIDQLNTLQLRSFMTLQSLFDAVINDLMHNTHLNGTYEVVLYESDDTLITMDVEMTRGYDGDGCETECRLTVKDKLKDDCQYQLTHSDVGPYCNWSDPEFDVVQYPHQVYPKDIILTTNNIITTAYSPDTTIDERMRLARIPIDLLAELRKNFNDQITSR